MNQRPRADMSEAIEGAHLSNRWKIARELISLKNRVAFWFVRPIELLCARYVGVNRDQVTPLAQSRVTRGAKLVVIFLVYQPRGFSSPAVNTLSYLAKNGFECCVVANGGLPEASKQLIRHIPGVLIERPNFGRDFGGYQAGWKYLRASGQALGDVLFLNDSVWFPATTQSAVLETIKSQSEEVVGFADLGAIDSDPSSRVLASYFLYFRQSEAVFALLDDFWGSYKPSNFHHYTIKAGERKLSALIKRSGLGWSAVFDNQKLYQHLIAQSEDEIHFVLKYAAYQDKSFAIEGKRLLGIKEKSIHQAQWKQQALQHMHAVLARRSGMASFPIGCLSMLHWDCVKRGSTVLQRQAVGAIYRAYKSEDLPALDVSVTNEIGRSKNGLVFHK